MAMYTDKRVRRTLEEPYIPEYLKQAQKAEFRELRDIVSEKQNVAILDIGVGNARIPIQLAESWDVWKKVRKYDGIDNSPQCVQAAREKISRSGLEGKVEIIQCDAKDLSSLQRTYGLIICTYFTAGNFYPDTFSFETDQDGQLVAVPNLERNESFRCVFRAAYDSLNPGGELVLGSVYIDTDGTRKKQEEFYRNCGMTVITTPEHSFTATKEGFWSQRFTHERVRSYLDWIHPRHIRFIPLDSYDFAEMVRIAK